MNQIFNDSKKAIKDNIFSMQDIEEIFKPFINKYILIDLTGTPKLRHIFNQD